jgi:hypothetical protein
MGLPNTGWLGNNRSFYCRLQALSTPPIMKLHLRPLLLGIALIVLSSPAISQNQCLELDGVFPSMMEIPSDPSLDLTGPYTLEMWVWANVINPSHEANLMRRQESTVRADYHFGVTRTSQVYGHHNWGHNNHVGTSALSSAIMPLHQWIHLAFSYDPSASTLRVFLNGGEVASNTGMEVPWVSTSDIWIGGWDHLYESASWNGRIDELRVWSIAKTGPQIVADMGQAIDQHPDLVSVWHFDGNANDAVGSNHGSLLGGATFVPSDVPFDLDHDNDGLLDDDEISIHGTNPDLFDTDGDGLGDGQELGVTYVTAPGDTNPAIFIEDSDPLTTTDPLLYDSDTGGASDGNEDVNKNGAVDASEGDPNAGADDLFQMSVQGLSPNQQATISVWDCHPGFVVVPFYSLAGQASNVLANYNQLELQLTQPVTQLSGMQASASGNAFSVVWVPPFAPIGRTVYWQAVEVAPSAAAYRPSIPLTTVIQ